MPTKPKPKNPDRLSPETLGLIDTLKKLRAEDRAEVDARAEALESQITESRARSIETAEAVSRAALAQITEGPIREIIEDAQITIELAVSDIEEHIAECHRQAVFHDRQVLTPAIRAYAAIGDKDLLAASIEQNCRREARGIRPRDLACSTIADHLRSGTWALIRSTADSVSALREAGAADKLPVGWTDPPAEYQIEHRARDAVRRYRRALSGLHRMDALEASLEGLEKQYETLVERIAESAGIGNAAVSIARPIIENLDNGWVNLRKDAVASMVFDEVKGDLAKNNEALGLILRRYSRRALG